MTVQVMIGKSFFKMKDKREKLKFLLEKQKSIPKKLDLISKKAGNNAASGRDSGGASSSIRLDNPKFKETTGNTNSLSKLQQSHNSRLESSKFRWLNQQLYTTPSTESFQLFQSQPDLYHIYHQGFSKQASKWPVNPVDIIIKDLNKLITKKIVVADMGCGDAKIGRELSQKIKIHSFDLHAGNPLITACDIANVPLSDTSCDVVIYCLSLMGTNLKDFLFEGHRVLKNGGLLKVAEVVSRMDCQDFITKVEKLGFKFTRKRESSKMFVLLDFVKVARCDFKASGPVLKPCMYKKR